MGGVVQGYGRGTVEAPEQLNTVVPRQIRTLQFAVATMSTLVCPEQQPASHIT